jgi:hypothetical protein
VATVQVVQPTPESAVIVRPEGGVSVTVTGPLVGEVPTFATVTVYVMVCPGRAVIGVCVFVIDRSIPEGEPPMTVGSVAVLFAAFESPPPDTTAVFVSVPDATPAPTLVVTVIGG